MRRLFALALTLVVLAAAPALAGDESDLDAFLAKPEPKYRWEKKGEEVVNGVKAYDLAMVSQEWREFTWEHRLMVFVPEKVDHPGFCTVFNTGGKGGKKDLELGALIAKQSGAVFAILFGIPNQPLWGKTEDTLIAHTWVKFIKSFEEDGKGDTTWPLHFPMAKSVVKSMDAIQAFAPTAGLPPIERFCISGASKRGWTTWLVGASRDPRVKAIAPMVIDILNVAKQGEHMLESYGKPSEQIAAYTIAGMGTMLKTPGGKKLLELCDPWCYRDRLTMPKLIVLGTNDRYWTQDALNIYWDDLQGPKWVIYVPNSGHGLEDRNRVIATMTAFIRSVAGGEPMPKITWTYKEGELSVASDPAPLELRLFRTESKSLDFRDSKWAFEKAEGTRATFAAPKEGNSALFGELVYAMDGKRYTLSTQIKILKSEPTAAAAPAKAPASGKKFY